MARSMVVGSRGGLAVDDGGGAGARPGIPLVLVHGATGAASHWLPVAERLRARRRVVVPELPGHGLSDVPRDVDWSTEALAEALHLLCQELELERFVLAGHSLAGNVVAQYAAQHGEEVAALAFVDAGRWVPTPAELEELRRGFRPEAYQGFTQSWFEGILAGARPATRDLVLRGLRAMPRENFMALVYGGLGQDLGAVAARYRGRKLALCAAATGVAARWAGSDAEVKVLPGVSHWLQLDAPDEVAEAIEEWIRRVAP
jgi:pimeloyl-ACP methyl ester carboxylesterase